MASKQSRLLRLSAWAGLVLAAGLAYALFVTRTGLAIPCLFHQVTGLLCPGCGVTRMCLALLRLDFPAAWQANPGLFLALPFLAVLLFSMAQRYVRSGSHRLSRWQSGLVWVLVGWMLLYGVLRNLPTLLAQL